MLAARFSRTHRPTRAIGACCTARRAAVAELAGMLDDDGVTVERLVEYAGRGYPAGGDCAARGRGGSPTEAAVEQRDAFALEPVTSTTRSSPPARRFATFASATRARRPVKAEGGELLCRSCGRDGARERSTRRRSDRCLCRWCYAFQACHRGKLPPREVLEVRARGGRVAQQLVDRALTRTG